MIGKDFESRSCSLLQPTVLLCVQIKQVVTATLRSERVELFSTHSFLMEAFRIFRQLSRWSFREIIGRNALSSLFVCCLSACDLLLERNSLIVIKALTAIEEVFICVRLVLDKRDGRPFLHHGSGNFNLCIIYGD